MNDQDNENRCPVGGKFGVDVGDLDRDACIDCKGYIQAQCYRESLKIKSAVPDDKALPDKSPEPSIAEKTGDNEVKAVPNHKQPVKPFPIAEEINQCPAGGKFGFNIDDLKECSGCKAWVECALEYQIMTGMVPAGTVMPLTSTDPQQRKPAEPKKGKQCNKHNPLDHDCNKCRKMPDCRAYLHWYVQMPHFILDDYLATLSGSAVKIFLYLNKTANYKEGHNHFGRCWLTYEQITAATGVNVVGKPVKELVGHKLIELIQTKKQNENGKWYIINEFTVRWRKCMLPIGKPKKT